MLVFFQGGTCPHCLQQLKMLRDYAGTPGAAALRVVAVSPEPRAALARTQKWLGGNRTLLLSDETTAVLRQFHCLAAEGPGTSFSCGTPKARWFGIASRPWP